MTHTNEETEPFWEIDLGAAYPIDEIRIFNRTDCCQERLRNFTVFYTNNRNGFRYRSLSDTLGQLGDNEATAVNFTPVFAPAGIIVDTVTGRRLPGASITLDGGWIRFIRIQLAGRGILSLAEVEVIQKAEIAGPAGLADATTWRPTSHSSTTSGTLVTTRDQLLLLSRGEDRRLHLSQNFGPENTVTGSPMLADSQIGGTYSPDTSQLYAAAREFGRSRVENTPLWSVEGVLAPTGLASPHWQQIDVTDAPPALLIGCGKLVIAWRRNGGVYSRWRDASPSGTWSPVQQHGSARSMPTLATNSTGEIALAFIGGQGSVVVRQAACGGSTLDWSSNGPLGREAIGDQVAVAAWGPLFAVAILAADQQAYFAIQLARSGSWTSYEPIGAPTDNERLGRTPRLAVFAGAIVALNWFDGNSVRYWVRSPSTIAARDGWIGGTRVGTAGVVAEPPTFASVGRSSVWSVYGAPAELFALARNSADNAAHIINLGRFVANDVIAHTFRLTAGAQRGIDPQPDRGMDITLIPNLFEEMMALLALPRAAWAAVSSTRCQGVDRATELILDPQAVGSTSSGRCPLRTMQNASNGGAVDGLMHEWMHLDFARRNIVAWEGFSSAFKFRDSGTDAAASGLRACRLDADCGGDACEAAGNNRGGTAASTMDFASGETTLRRWDQTLVCVSRRDGPNGRRYQGGVWWYDLGTSDHAFIDTATMYRWYGEDLRDLVAADAGAHNTQLRERYDWLRDHYFGGVEYNGRLPATNTDRNIGQQGFPNR